MIRGDRDFPGELPSSYIIPVELKEKRLGHQVQGRNQELDLRAMFNRGYRPIAEQAEFKYSAVYFRTRGERVYKLWHSTGDRGKLVGPSIDTGLVVEETFWDEHIPPRRALYVGGLFIYDSGGLKHTPVVTEIVGVLRDSPSIDELRRITEGRSSSIIEDFQIQPKQ